MYYLRNSKCCICKHKAFTKKINSLKQIKINHFIFMDKTAVHLNNENIKALFIEDSEITRHVSCPCCNFVFQPDLKHLQLPVTPCYLLLSTETLGKVGFTLI